MDLRTRAILTVKSSATGKLADLGSVRPSDAVGFRLRFAAVRCSCIVAVSITASVVGSMTFAHCPRKMPCAPTLACDTLDATFCSAGTKRTGNRPTWHVSSSSILPVTSHKTRYHRI
jgi:hypothetical protein